MNDHAQTNRRKSPRLLFLAVLALLCIVGWLALRPRYVVLNIPFEPADSAWGAESRIILHEAEWTGGGKYFVFRKQGFAREREGWTREKAVRHFDQWLVAHGWQAAGPEENGSGVWYDWQSDADCGNVRYHRAGKPAEDFPRVTLTVSHDRRREAEQSGLRMWRVVVDSVNPSWGTVAKRAFDD